MNISEPTGTSNLKKGQSVRNTNYVNGTIFMLESDGEDAKLTVMFNRLTMKNLMEKFANLRKL